MKNNPTTSTNVNDYISWNDVEAVVMMNENDYIHGPLCTKKRLELKGITKIITQINYVSVHRGEKTTPIPAIIRFCKRAKIDDMQFYLHVCDGKMRHYVEIRFDDGPTKHSIMKALRQRHALAKRQQAVGNGQHVEIVIAGEYKAQPVYIVFKEDGECGRIQIFGNRIAALMLKKKLNNFLERENKRGTAR